MRWLHVADGIVDAVGKFAGFVKLHGLAPDVALDEVASELFEAFNLVVVLNAFGDDLGIHDVSHVNDRLDEVDVHVVTDKIVDKRFINLNQIDRQLHELLKRCITCSEIIKGYHDLVVAQHLDVLDGMITFLNKRVFRDLDLEALGRESELFYDRKKPLRKARTRDVLCGNVDGDRDRVSGRIAYLTELLKSLADHECIDIKNKVGKLGDCDKFRRWDFHPVGCVHADKSLEAAKAFVLHRVLRLIDKVEPAFPYTVLNKALYVALALQDCLHLVVEQAELGIAGLDGIVHRDVGLFHDRVDISVLSVKIGHAGKRGQIAVGRHSVLVKGDRVFYLVYDLFHELVMIDPIAYDQRIFRALDLVGFDIAVDHGADPVGNDIEELVTVLAAEIGVDGPEAVKMNKDDAALLIVEKLPADVVVKSVPVQKPCDAVGHGHHVAVFDLSADKGDRDDKDERVESSRRC